MTNEPQIFNPLPQLISFLFGFLTAIFAEPLRQLIFRPTLKVQFGESEDYLSLTPEEIQVNDKSSKIKAYYIRVKVTNIRRAVAKDCKVYLVNVEKEDDNGKFKPTIYCDYIPLAWSCQNMGEQYRGIDLNKGVNQFADVITTREISSVFYPPLKLFPFRYQEIFSQKGTFRFTVQVTSANTEPKTIKIVFHWDGKWDKFQVYSRKGRVRHQISKIIIMALGF